MKTNGATVEMLKIKVKQEGIAAVSEWVEEQRIKDLKYYNHIILSLLWHLKEEL